MYDGDTVVEEVGPSGTTYELPGVGYVSSSSGTNTQNYYFDNALGTTLSVLNSAGSSQSRTEYDGYGITYPEVAGAQSDFRFVGKHGYVTDDDTGFDMLGHRYYIPQLGRFLTQDPIGQKGGLNLYEYCNDNPITNSDPSGTSMARSYQDEKEMQMLEMDGYSAADAQRIVGAAEARETAKDNSDVALGFNAIGYTIGAFDGVDFLLAGRAIVGAVVKRVASRMAVKAAAKAAAEGGASKVFPGSAEEMDSILGFEGKRIPDGPTTPGRNKVQWKPSGQVEITFESHPYDVGGSAEHTGPHWHLGTPGNEHQRFLPGDRFPGL